MNCFSGIGVPFSSGERLGLLQRGSAHPAATDDRRCQSDFTPEQRHVLELAFNSTIRKLDLVDRDDPVCEIAAQRMINIYKRGVTDAVALTEITIREIVLPKE